MTADGSKTTSNVTLRWQTTSIINWNITKYSTEANAKTDFNGKSNTTAIINAIKAYDTSHSTDNITGNIGGAIQAFAPEGTVAGDWYIGSAGELYKVYENKTAIMASADKIYNAGSTLGMRGNTLISSNYCLTSTESEYGVWLERLDNGGLSSYGQSYSTVTRPLLRV